MLTLTADVSILTEIAQVGKKAQEKRGRFDAVFANAGTGLVNTPFFDEAKLDKLDSSEIVNAVLYANLAHPDVTLER